MSSTTNTKRKSYDVYLGLCHKYAYYFALELYTALTSEAGITVFWDGERIGRGDQEISTSVLNVIEDCKVVVVILSKNYMYSSPRWYLQELEKITECYRTENGPIVLPVFYSPEEMSPEYMYGKAFFHGFLDRISMKEKTSSEDEDKFMSWVAEISNEASKYAALAFLRYGPNE
jgi:hypothetical protein